MAHFIKQYIPISTISHIFDAAVNIQYSANMRMRSNLLSLHWYPHQRRPARDSRGRVGFTTFALLRTLAEEFFPLMHALYYELNADKLAEFSQLTLTSLIIKIRFIARRACNNIFLQIEAWSRHGLLQSPRFTELLLPYKGHYCLPAFHTQHKLSIYVTLATCRPFLAYVRLLPSPPLPLLALTATVQD